MHEHGVATVDDLSNVRRFAFACPALLTCGLAVVESERMMPTLIGELDAELAKLGLDGKSREGKYTLFVGGNQTGTRMNSAYRDLVPASRIAAELRPLFLFYKGSRSGEESFGDFCARVGGEALRAFSEASMTPPQDITAE